MNFIEALTEVMAGKRLYRRKWGRNRRCIYLISNGFQGIRYIELKDVGQSSMYTASSEDMLANDWNFYSDSYLQQYEKRI